MCEAKLLNSPPNQHSVDSGIWDHTLRVCERAFTNDLCVHMQQEREKLIRPEVLIKV